MPLHQMFKVIWKILGSGDNTLVDWYDMHHFDVANDPKAVAFRNGLHVILTAAKRIGINGGRMN